MSSNDPNIWIQLYENTPTVLRWLLSVLTLGLLSVYHYLWKRQQERLLAIEVRERNYATKTDIDEVKAGIAITHEDVKKIMFHIMDKP